MSTFVFASLFAPPTSASASRSAQPVVFLCTAGSTGRDKTPTTHDQVSNNGSSQSHTGQQEAEGARKPAVSSVSSASSVSSLSFGSSSSSLSSGSSMALHTTYSSRCLSVSVCLCVLSPPLLCSWSTCLSAPAPLWLPSVQQVSSAQTPAGATIRRRARLVPLSAECFQTRSGWATGRKEDDSVSTWTIQCRSSTLCLRRPMQQVS